MNKEGTAASGRKRTPEELIDTVNRKYSMLFGRDLVKMKDTSFQDMDVGDFMKYLSNPKSKVVPAVNPEASKPY